MRRAFLQLLAVLAVFTLFAAACGDDDESAAADAESECVLGRGVSDTEIKLGSSQPLTGNLAALGEATAFALNGHVDRINAAGGINGRMLSLVIQDDEFMPEKAVANGQYFIEREKVFAVWGSVGTAPTSAAIEIHDDAEMLTLFPFALNKDLIDVVAHPLYFSHAPPAYAQTMAWGKWLLEDFRPNEELRIGMMVINSADGEQTTAGFEASIAADSLVDNQTWERDATTYGPQILSFIGNEVTDVYLGTADTQYAQFIQEADQLGLEARFWGSSGAITDNVIALTGDLSEGVFGVGFVASSTADIPGIQGYRDLMFGQGADATHLGTASLIAYLSGLVVEEGLRQAGECLNNDTFVDAMESITDFDTGGITQPMTFTSENHLGNNSVVIFEVQGGAWTRIN